MQLSDPSFLLFIVTPSALVSGISPTSPPMSPPVVRFDPVGTSRAPRLNPGSVAAEHPTFGKGLTASVASVGDHSPEHMYAVYQHHQHHQHHIPVQATALATAYPVNVNHLEDMDIERWLLSES